MWDMRSPFRSRLEIASLNDMLFPPSLSQLKQLCKGVLRHGAAMELRSCLQSMKQRDCRRSSPGIVKRTRTAPPQVCTKNEKRTSSHRSLCPSVTTCHPAQLSAARASRLTIARSCRWGDHPVCVGMPDSLSIRAVRPVFLQEIDRPEEAYVCNTATVRLFLISMKVI